MDDIKKTDKLNPFNNINDKIDYDKIRLYLKIGILGACIVLAGDILMGWGLKDASLSGIESTASQYLGVSDKRMYISSLCGLIGVPIAVIGHVGIYKMIKPYSAKYAKLYLVGTLGFLSCGGAGVHVSSTEAAFFYKHMNIADPSMALINTMNYVSHFLVPLYIVVIISWIIIVYAHIRVVLGNFSPYSKACFLSSMLVGTSLTSTVGLLGNHEWVNALMLGAFSVGNMWTLIGHYIILSRLKLQK